jgi:uncharacterized protein
MVEKDVRIIVARLTEDPQEFSGTLSRSILEMENEKFVRPVGDIEYELYAQLLGTEALIRGKMSQRFVAMCSRCAEDFEFTLEISDFTYCVETHEKTDILDLTNELRECIILELPSYPICRDDCLGICQTCHTNLNKGECSCKAEVSNNCWGALDALKGSLIEDDLKKKEK